MSTMQKAYDSVARRRSSVGHNPRTFGSAPTVTTAPGSARLSTAARRSSAANSNPTNNNTNNSSSSGAPVWDGRINVEEKPRMKIFTQSIVTPPNSSSSVLMNDVDRQSVEEQHTIHQRASGAVVKAKKAKTKKPAATAAASSTSVLTHDSSTTSLDVGKKKLKKKKATSLSRTHTDAAASSTSLSTTPVTLSPAFTATNTAVSQQDGSGAYRGDPPSSAARGRPGSVQATSEGRAPRQGRGVRDGSGSSSTSPTTIPTTPQPRPASSHLNEDMIELEVSSQTRSRSSNSHDEGGQYVQQQQQQHEDPHELCSDADSDFDFQIEETPISGTATTPTSRGVSSAAAARTPAESGATGDWTRLSSRQASLQDNNHNDSTSNINNYHHHHTNNSSSSPHEHLLVSANGSHNELVTVRENTAQTSMTRSARSNSHNSSSNDSHGSSSPPSVQLCSTPPPQKQRKASTTDSNDIAAAQMAAATAAATNSTAAAAEAARTATTNASAGTAVVAASLEDDPFNVSAESSPQTNRSRRSANDRVSLSPADVSGRREGKRSTDVSPSRTPVKSSGSPVPPATPPPSRSTSSALKEKNETKNDTNNKNDDTSVDREADPVHAAAPLEGEVSMDKDLVRCPTNAPGELERDEAGPAPGNADNAVDNNADGFLHSAVVEEEKEGGREYTKEDAGSEAGAGGEEARGSERLFVDDQPASISAPPPPEAPPVLEQQEPPAPPQKQLPRYMTGTSARPVVGVTPATPTNASNNNNNADASASAASSPVHSISRARARLASATPLQHPPSSPRRAPPASPLATPQAPSQLSKLHTPPPTCLSPTTTPTLTTGKSYAQRTGTNSNAHSMETNGTAAALRRSSSFTSPAHAIASPARFSRTSSLAEPSPCESSVARRRARRIAVAAEARDDTHRMHSSHTGAASSVNSTPTVSALRRTNSEPINVRNYEERQRGAGAVYGSTNNGGRPTRDASVHSARRSGRATAASPSAPSLSSPPPQEETQPQVLSFELMDRCIYQAIMVDPPNINERIAMPPVMERPLSYYEQGMYNRHQEHAAVHYKKALLHEQRALLRNTAWLPVSRILDQRSGGVGAMMMDDFRHMARVIRYAQELENWKAALTQRARYDAHCTELMNAAQMRSSTLLNTSVKSATSAAASPKAASPSMHRDNYHSKGVYHGEDADAREMSTATAALMDPSGKTAATTTTTAAARASSATTGSAVPLSNVRATSPSPQKPAGVGETTNQAVHNCSATTASAKRGGATSVDSNLHRASPHDSNNANSVHHRKTDINNNNNGSSGSGGANAHAAGGRKTVSHNPEYSDSDVDEDGRATSRHPRRSAETPSTAAPRSASTKPKADGPTTATTACTSASPSVKRPTTHATSASPPHAATASKSASRAQGSAGTSDAKVAKTSTASVAPSTKKKTGAEKPKEKDKDKDKDKDKKKKSDSPTFLDWLADAFGGKKSKKEEKSKKAAKEEKGKAEAHKSKSESKPAAAAAVTSSKSKSIAKSEPAASASSKKAAVASSSSPILIRPAGPAKASSEPLPSSNPPPSTSARAATAAAAAAASPSTSMPAVQAQASQSTTAAASPSPQPPRNDSLALLAPNTAVTNESVTDLNSTNASTAAAALKARELNASLTTVEKTVRTAPSTSPADATSPFTEDLHVSRFPVRSARCCSVELPPAPTPVFRLYNFHPLEVVQELKRMAWWAATHRFMVFRVLTGTTAATLSESQRRSGTVSSSVRGGRHGCSEHTRHHHDHDHDPQHHQHHQREESGDGCADESTCSVSRRRLRRAAAVEKAGGAAAAAAAAAAAGTGDAALSVHDSHQHPHPHHSHHDHSEDSVQHDDLSSCSSAASSCDSNSPSMDSLDSLDAVAGGSSHHDAVYFNTVLLNLRIDRWLKQHVVLTRRDAARGLVELEVTEAAEDEAEDAVEREAEVLDAMQEPSSVGRPSNNGSSSSIADRRVAAAMTYFFNSDTRTPR